MKYQSARIAHILLDDPTRQLQLFGAIGSWCRAAYALLFDPFVWNWPVAAAFFYYYPPWSWAITLFVFGCVQWWAASLGPNRWKVKFWVANIQFALVVYGLVVTVLTGQLGGQGVPLAATTGLLQFWIAWRALQDRELNGTDRRA